MPPYESIDVIAEMRDRIEKELGKIISIMVDLKGEELRLLIKGKEVEVKSGEKYIISGPTFEGSDIMINVEKAIDEAMPGDFIMAMDGKIIMSVVEKKEKYLKVMASSDGIIKNNGRVNIPGRYIPVASVTERDRQFLEKAIMNKVEFCAMSFVQTPSQINELHDLIIDLKGNMKII
ncbi:pyruvate kinase, partial [mine drainage metagenome]